MKLQQISSDYPGAPFISPDDVKNIRVLYHGSKIPPEVVQRQGLLTRETQGLPPKDRDSTYQDSVYLALKASEIQWYGPYVYAIDFSKLDKTKLEADEDATGHSSDEMAYKWWGSLMIMGTCRYVDSIPPEHIKLVKP